MRTEPTSLSDPPKITAITPSYNQGQFLEETIRSVLDQNYPNLEYMVIDGGSSDQSVEIIRKYASRLTFWESLPDRGQAHAINKGFLRCTGELVGWINSDDLLMPGSLNRLAEAHREHPNAILAGDVINFTAGRRRVRKIVQKNITQRGMIFPQLEKVSWHQPGIYVPGARISEFLLDEKLRYFFDQDWLCRLLGCYSVVYLKKPIAKFRLHSASKTVGEKFDWYTEQEMVVRQNWDRVEDVNKQKILAFFELVQAAVSLGKTHYDRHKGISHLRQARRLYPAWVFSTLYTQLILRSWLPYPWMMRFRTALKKLPFHLME